jgi:hypothetical protein
MGMGGDMLKRRQEIGRQVREILCYSYRAFSYIPEFKPMK